MLLKIWKNATQDFEDGTKTLMNMNEISRSLKSWKSLWRVNSFLINFGACVPFGKSWIIEIPGALETQRADCDSDMATQTKNMFFWQPIGYPGGRSQASIK